MPDRLRRVLLVLTVALGAAVMLFPFLWTVITSITPDGSLADGPTLWVDDPTLAAYRSLVDTVPIWRILVNSIVIALAATLLQVVTGSMAAYGFSRLRFPGRNVIFALYLATMMVPFQVLV